MNNVTGKVIQFAKENDYDSAEYDGEWNGFDVYYPTFTDGKDHFLGLPLAILVKGEKIRFTTPSEAWDYYHYRHPIDESKITPELLELISEISPNVYDE